MLKKFARTGALVAAAGLALSMSACSGGQSVAEACKVANETVNEVNQDTQQIMQDALSGGDMTELFAPVEKALDDAQSKITNEEVATKLGKVQDEFSAMSSKLEGVEMPDMSNIDPTDPDAMADLESQQAELEQLSTDMQESSEALMAAGQDLQETCNAG